MYYEEYLVDFYQQKCKNCGGTRNPNDFFVRSGTMLINDTERTPVPEGSEE